MRGQQHFRGTPSFEPLYQSERGTQVPETANYLHGDTCPSWADVLLDMRVETERVGVLPQTLPIAERVWRSSAVSWSMAAYVFEPDGAPDHHRADNEAARRQLTRTGNPRPPLRDSVTVLLITDPTQFRFGFVVSEDRPGGKSSFANGRLALLLPSMKHLILSGLANRAKDAHSSHVVSHPFPGPLRGQSVPAADTQAGFDVEALRDAVADPRAWLGLPVDCSIEEVEEYAFPGPFRPISGLRALAAWSAGGATVCDETTRHWIEGGLDPVEADAWTDRLNADRGHTLGLTWTQADIVNWFAHLGGGRKAREYAAACTITGVDRAVARRWEQYMRDGANGLNDEWKSRHQYVAAFEAAGWTPQMANQVVWAIVEDARIPGSQYATPSPHTVRRLATSLASQWTFTTATTAITHLRAGMTPEASKAMHERGETAPAATLEMLTGLRQPLVATAAR